MESDRKFFIIGLGNILLKDEGFGVHFVEYLKTKKLSKNLEIIDAGTSVFDLLPLLNTRDYFIFVDVIKTKVPAGSIFRFDRNSIELLNSPRPTGTYPAIFRKECGKVVGRGEQEFFSLHQIGFLELLNSCKLLNKNINFTIFAVVPKIIAWGMDLSPSLKKKLPQVARLIKKELRCNFV